MYKMSKKIHSKKIGSIEDPIFKTVLPKNDDNYHNWEKNIDGNTKLWFTGKIIKNISYPSPSMLTVQGILTNFHFTTKELYLICNPISYVKRIKSGNNPPKNQPGFVYNKTDDDVRGFDSQITLWISQEYFNKKSNGVYKVKIFNNVNGVGKIQIPGIKNINDTINIVKYVRNYINSQNFIYHNLHLLIDRVPNKLIKMIYENIFQIVMTSSQVNKLSAIEIAKLKDQMAKTGIEKESIVRRTWMAESILLFKQKKAMAAIKVIDQLIDALPSAPGPKEYQYLCDFVNSKTKDKAALKYAQANWCKFGLR
jgi:uncharacterized protein YcgL (UPF0745 family)